ncbi:unnamed protein product [Cuscuta europaea]|uniref:Uncharacterized protein n=1 Tax=Cuscuta europaea TaxID=41803 RepID=A0A9P0ZJZ9_CUSEU|nr:unnamed protein product [Cuscuta europaea]
MICTPLSQPHSSLFCGCDTLQRATPLFHYEEENRGGAAGDEAQRKRDNNTKMRPDEATAAQRRGSTVRRRRLHSDAVEIGNPSEVLEGLLEEAARVIEMAVVEDPVGGRGVA